MTYKEIQASDLSLTEMELSPVQMAAYEIILVMHDREGFDFWWHEIPADSKEEIFQDIQNSITQHTTHHDD